MRVLVVEDDGFTRLAIASALRMAGFEVLAAESAREAVAKGKDFAPKAALLDLHLGAGPSGLDLARQLRREDPKVGLVFLTSFSSPRLLSSKAELPKGALYLTKSSVQSPQVLVESLKNSVESPNDQASFNSKLAKLTDLQIETLRLVAAGYSNSEIAKRRFVTEQTVEKTIARASKVLGLGANQEQNQRVRIARLFLEETGQSVKSI